MLPLRLLHRSALALAKGTRASLLVVVAALTLGVAAPAGAQLTDLIPSLRTLEQRVLGLETQVGQLIQQVQAGAGAAGAAGIQGQQLNSNMADLADEVRRLTGQVEDMQFALDDLRALQSALLTFEQRLAAVEQRSQQQAQALAQVQDAASASEQAALAAQAPVATLPAASTLPSVGNQVAAQPPVVPQPTVPVLDRGQGPASVSPAGLAVIAATPKQGQAAGSDALSGLISEQAAAGQQTLGQASEADRLYQQAIDAIKQGQFAAAQPMLQQFIDTYADHPLLQNAQYWMGETYYAQQDYTSAAAYFTRAYRQDAQGPKAPDTLLKLGYSLFALGKPNDGCKVLNALFEQHEAARQEVLSLAAETLSERGC